jgi:hypothetical protein
MRSPGEHPTFFGKTEPASLNERACFGVEAVRDPVSGRIFELGSGALPPDQQALLFAAEAAKGSKLTELEAQLLLAQAKAKAPA